MTKDQRIHFYRASASPSLLSWLVNTKGYEPAGIEFLLGFGAIYVNERRWANDGPLKDEDLIRVHREPRRFPRAQDISAGHILAETPDFVIAQKPAFVPTHATLDNARENLLARLEGILRKPLYPAHRLDVGTSGLCLLATAPRAQHQWQILSRNDQITKLYAFITEKPAVVGLHVHYQKKRPRAPHLMLRQHLPETRECRLEILETEPHEKGFRSVARLITGRTHQIRAQLSALSAPLLGDTLYGGTAADRIYLHASHLAFTWQKTPYNFSSALPF